MNPSDVADVLRKMADTLDEMPPEAGEDYADFLVSIASELLRYAEEGAVRPKN